MVYLPLFTYIWLIFMVNVGKYTIHGSSGVVEHVKYVDHFGAVCICVPKFTVKKHRHL